ncbi:MAG: heavy metal translocating P-type ATPase, partial [Clostridia bacterium]|nr:heavy metal translocating P-type ATPase [Clostridia bacterium]
VIIADDNLIKIPYAIKKSKLIKRKVIANIICSVAVKVAIMALSIFTPLPIWLAMFGDVGVMLLALLNSLSISLYK